MNKQNALIFCLISCMHQSLSWSSSEDDLNIDKLCENSRNFTQIMDNNENHNLTIFENPHEQENLGLRFISYIGIPDKSIYVIDPSSNTQWQHLVLIRFGSRVVTNVNGHSLDNEQTLTLTQYFYSLCHLQVFPFNPFVSCLAR